MQYGYEITEKVIAEGLKFVHNPPFIQFEIENKLGEKIKDLNLIPKSMTIYEVKYILGGCTIHDGGNYYAYIFHEDSGVFYFYDGLGPKFHQTESSEIRSEGVISLLIYFMYDNDLLSSVVGHKPQQNIQAVPNSSEDIDTKYSAEWGSDQNILKNKIGYNFRSNSSRNDGTKIHCTPGESYLNRTSANNDAAIAEVLQCNEYNIRSDESFGNSEKKRKSQK